MIWRALAVAVVLGAATPAGAGDPPRTGKAQVYYSVTPEQVAAVLRKAGFKTKIVADEVEEGEKPTWTIEARDKTPFYMAAHVRVCDADGYPKGCLGIRFYASMTLDPGDLAAARRTADRYNRLYDVGKVYVSGDGKALYFENYLMIEGGVTVRHLEENLDNFLGGYNVMVDQFEEQSKAEVT